MKQILTFIVLLSLFLMVACTQQQLPDTDDKQQAVDPKEQDLEQDEKESTPAVETKGNDDTIIDQTELEAESFKAKSPVAKYTKEDIDSLGIDCRGTNPEIAQCIFDWQQENMIYLPTTAEKETFPQSYAIRWADLLPGIYTSKDVIEVQRSEENKVFGVCWEYSIVYCSIADYYGLDCRVMESFSVGDDIKIPGGMGTDEYSELKKWLDKNELDYPYEAVRLAMPMEDAMPMHYWAEVKVKGSEGFMNSEWLVVDASNKKYDGRSRTMDLIKTGEGFKVVDWLSKDKSDLLKDYTARINAGEDLGRTNTGNNSDMDEFTQGRQKYLEEVESGREEEYVGITDELGNKNRAATVDDYMQGKALAPYMSSCEDTCDYILADEECKSACDVDESIMKCYKSCSGKEFFLVCDFICEDEEGDSWATCYKLCSGNNLDVSCDEKCAAD